MAEMGKIIDASTKADAEYEETKQLLLESIKYIEILSGKKIL